MSLARKAPHVTVRKVIAADRESVFRAWTDPKIMQEWFVGGPGTARVAVDLRVGGRYTNEMLISGPGSCGHGPEPASPTCTSYPHHGEYLEIVPPERLVFTWNSPSVQNTRVTVEFREVGVRQTEIVITHELTNESDCDGHTKGWSFALTQLSNMWE